MRTQNLQYLFIGNETQVFTDLVKILRSLKLNIQIGRTLGKKEKIIKALKGMQGANIIFISDNIHYPLPMLSDLIWQFNPDAIIVILTKKTASTPLRKPFNDTQIAKINIANHDNSARVFLHNLTQIVESKKQFRACKQLLGVSEKRSTWLLDSSREAVSYISRDTHLYANNAYLTLFGVASTQDLHSLSVSDIILEDERVLFDGFIKYQLKHQNISKTLHLSLCRVNGSKFRANIHVVPAIYKGKRCWQLWIQQIRGYKQQTVENKFPNMSANNEQIKPTRMNDNDKNPFEMFMETPKKKKQVNPDKILAGIIKRHEASISVQELVPLKKAERKNAAFKSYFMLSLNVPLAQINGVDSLLFSPSNLEARKERQIFWDKVKVARLIQILLRKEKLNTNFILTLSNASINDKAFSKWMLGGLKKLGSKTKNLTIMVPSNFEIKNRSNSVSLLRVLQQMSCQVALNNFTATPASLIALKHIKPSIVRLSLPWVRNIESHEKQEVALASLIRQLESKKIKVIAPCSFSSDMRRFFIFSGASFCQERMSKTA